MRKIIKGSHGGRVVNAGWMSFQPDGSVSFGLSDRTYVSPRFRERRFLWNVYNRVTVEYVVPSEPSTLLQVQNPHFTFHPDVMFHLKSNKDKKAEDEAIFEGIADVGIVLQQQGEMPWIRATSAPFDQLTETGRLRAPAIETEDLMTEAPVVMNTASMKMEVDFVRPEAVVEHREAMTWEYAWGKVGLRIRTGFVAPQIATLSWFHSA
jgi:hypothetical protein